MAMFSSHPVADDDHVFGLVMRAFRALADVVGG
jgi:hypothetical protein